MDTGGQTDSAFRQRVMSACAYASRQELSEAVAKLPLFSAAVNVRPPESGLVMVRGRIGGDGAPFNCGEVTVTRAAVAVEGNIIGHAHQLGRDKEKARLAAIIDANAQLADRQADVERLFLVPVEQRLQRQRQELSQKTAATRVDFFTLVRGED